MACPCCVGESYCCWDKDPTIPLGPGDLPATVSCQDTPCPGMVGPVPDDTLRRSGPYPNGTTCALDCKTNQCAIASNLLGPFLGGGYQSRVIDVGIGGAPNGQFSHIVYRSGPRVSRFALGIGVIADPGTLLSPTRFIAYATGEEDGAGNVIRYRQLLLDTGYVFAGLNDTCVPPFPPGNTSSVGVLPFVFFEPIEFPRCFEVVVMSPCRLTRWFYQLYLDPL
jgi:hypothetical protein